MTDFDQAPCGLLITNGDDQIVRVNDTFLRWTGYDRDALIGLDFSSLLHPGEQAFYATRYQDELWGRGEVREISLTLRRPDLSELPILLNAVTTRSDDGASGVRLAVFDATTRQDFEREMLAAKRFAEESETRVRTLQGAAARFLEARDAADLARRLGDSLRDAFAAAQTAIVRYDEHGAFEMLTASHLRDLLDAVRASRPEGPVALLPDQMVVIHDIEEAYARSDRVGDLLRAARGAALIGVPIGDGDTVLGAFACIFGRPRRFDEASLELYRALAKQAGLALSRIRLEERLLELAAHDQLTGVANRAALDEEMEHALQTAHRRAQAMSIVFVDLDGFKPINDQLGHPVGDAVLRTVADRISSAVRSTDRVGRYGGDEFVIVCPGADAEAAHEIAERVAATIRGSIDGLPDDLGVTASIGIASFDADDPDESALSLTRRADEAMYESKRGGGDRITHAGRGIA